VYRRRRVSHLLDEVLDDLYPPTLVPPSTFGLAPEELSRHVRTLLDAGWTIGEVGVVIDRRQVA
jgi:hypothetical protein